MKFLKELGKGIYAALITFRLICQGCKADVINKFLREYFKKE